MTGTHNSVICQVVLLFAVPLSNVYELVYVASRVTRRESCVSLSMSLSRCAVGRAPHSAQWSTDNSAGGVYVAYNVYILLELMLQL